MNALDRTWLRLALVGAGAAAVLAIVVGVAAAINGTATLTAGSLTLFASPSQVSFPSTALTGSVQYLGDTSDGTFRVVDATGSAAGWSITAVASTFTCDGTTTPSCSTTHTLGALETNGGTTEADTTSPVAACHVVSTCDFTTSSVGKVTVPTTGTATIFNQGAGHGMGDIDVTGLDWWLTVPYDAAPGGYKSTITLNIASGP